MSYNEIKQTIKLEDGREITITTGKLAKQANGSVEIIMGKTIKHISAPADDPMFTGGTIISAIMRAGGSPEVKPKKTKKEKGKEKKNRKSA